MEFDINKIISADEISADTQKISTKLTEKNELLVFDNNKPQFVILSLEKFEQLLAEKNLIENTVKTEKKIGKLVQDTFLKLVDKDMLPQEEINNLCKLEYSNATFSLNFAMLKRFNPDPDISIDMQKKDKNGYNRYYKYLININNEQYLLCSQWSELLHRKKYLEWLDKWNCNAMED